MQTDNQLIRRIKKKKKKKGGGEPSPNNYQK